ncbi:MAG TPA: hypothetical protein VGP93_07225, partial [Polyangiaceae bacterium]|nr:hypothetical protein [Polyangiaceae bacterium]
MKSLLSWPPARALLPLLLVLLLGCLFHGNGAFFEWPTHRALLREISVHGILACGMTIVIVSAGIDLSVGSVLGLCAVLFALLSMPLGWGSAAALCAVLLAGAACGAVSGLLVAFGRIQAFIVTLAMMVFARGLAKELSGGQKISNYVVGADGSQHLLPSPRLFRVLDSRVLGDQVAVVTLVFLACALVTHVVLAELRVGRYLYA